MTRYSVFPLIPYHRRVSDSLRMCMHKDNHRSFAFIVLYLTGTCPNGLHCAEQCLSLHLLHCLTTRTRRGG